MNETRLSQRESSRTNAASGLLGADARIAITLEITDSETVEAYVGVADDLIFEDLRNGSLMTKVNFVSRENELGHPRAQIQAPSSKPTTPEQPTSKGSSVQRLVGPLFSFIRGRLIIQGTQNVNRWLRRGWHLKSVDAKHWPTGRGGFDSAFIYTLVPRSRILRFVAEKVDKLFLKAAILLNLSLQAPSRFEMPCRS